jgi:hypothetical protein
LNRISFAPVTLLFNVTETVPVKAASLLMVLVPAGATESMYLPSALVDALLRTSHEVGATLFMTLLAAFKAVLQRHTGRDDIVIGTAISGRTQLETEGLVGFFANTLALRTRMDAAGAFRDLPIKVARFDFAANRPCQNLFHLGLCHRCILL